MDVVTAIALACPVCGAPRKIGKGAHGRRGPLKTCGKIDCVAELRSRSNKFQDQHLEGAGEKPFPAAMARKEGPKTCPQCFGATYDTSYDGVSYWGCDRCHWETRTTPLARPAGWHEPKLRPAPSEAFLAQARGHRANRDATGRYRSPEYVERMRLAGMKGAAARRKVVS